MKPEALDAMATQTMRPKALDAAMAPDPGKEKHSEESKSPTPKKSQIPSTRPDSPASDQNDKSYSVGHVVDDVVHGVKAVMDGVLSWAEEKVEGLSAENDDTGPYSSPALCAPSDMDPIASGILPAINSQNAHEHDRGETQSENPEKVGNEDGRERKE